MLSEKALSHSGQQYKKEPSKAIAIRMCLFRAADGDFFLYFLDFLSFL